VSSTFVSTAAVSPDPETSRASRNRVLFLISSGSDILSPRSLSTTQLHPRRLFRSHESPYHNEHRPYHSLVHSHQPLPLPQEALGRAKDGQGSRMKSSNKYMYSGTRLIDCLTSSTKPVPDVRIIRKGRRIYSPLLSGLKGRSRICKSREGLWGLSDHLKKRHRGTRSLGIFYSNNIR